MPEEKPDLKKTPGYLRGRDSLPEELWPMYERLIADYKYHALLRTGRGWVAYDVIADLVKFGWTRPE